MDVFDQVDRRNLETYKVSVIGEGNQGDIYKISVDGRIAALKDIAKRNLFYRFFFGRWLLSRECKVYQQLLGLSGIPKLYKVIDKDGFIFEFIDGVPLSKFSKDAPIPRVFFDALDDLIRRMHDHGVVHSDLKHKKNILVSKGYRPYLVDFGASMILGGTWNPLGNWLYKQFSEIDLKALSKIRNRFVHGNPDDEDKQNLLKRNFMERSGRLYQSIYRLFSRKHKWKR
ncbi:MAG: hypothetical protein CO150_05860 [Nitrospirae bacterium CG_4_9_14_3_um_filter_53_35]|nr:MAG: hypothetical protein AUK29_04375 [Nitrospirae bacterium CG2_30_53_67]PIS38070.1 MAG: hypothetical protein COT35_02660 [Nitrospirae bacterium CG08_land_8_20_14_0_20_52_24]PIV85688.1 MAG: hypothetical protein COW52_00880 [Nitrospirae bacterium CG17_big_fil_post_rev_8_21_14_2_50_50_9]PIW85437.1 MAG: hypothetical protein COZ95_04620 [Nitrospirae bacterium CG_4_8_14_3_um_filter_50_41]PIX87014.1 MAG: hypothetical protein COZ32_00540 [Nitrospirae bacterium CG_4_10_14_3_um_filter_53_41]PJA7480